MDDRAAVARHGLELSGSQFVERGRADGHAEPAHTTAQYGWITGAFLVTYPLGGPLTGYLMERIGLRFGFLLCGPGVVPDLHGARLRHWLGGSVRTPRHARTCRGVVHTGRHAPCDVLVSAARARDSGGCRQYRHIGRRHRRAAADRNGRFFGTTGKPRS